MKNLIYLFAIISMQTANAQNDLIGDKFVPPQQRDNGSFSSAIEQFRKHFFDDPFFGSTPFGGTETSALQISQSQTADAFTYTIQAENIDKQNLKIDIKGDMLHLEGRIKTTETIERDGMTSYSSSSSYISRSLPIPSGYNAEAAKFKKEKNKLIVEFPKL